MTWKLEDLWTEEQGSIEENVTFITPRGGCYFGGVEPENSNFLDNYTFAIWWEDIGYGATNITEQEIQAFIEHANEHVGVDLSHIEDPVNNWQRVIDELLVAGCSVYDSDTRTLVWDQDAVDIVDHVRFGTHERCYTLPPRFNHGVCLFCGHDDIWDGYQETDYGDEQVWKIYKCPECGAKHQEIFELSHVEVWTEEGEN